MKSYKDKKILYSLIALGLFAGIGGSLFESAGHIVLPTITIGDIGKTNVSSISSASAILATEQNLETKLPFLPTITLGFVGDIMTTRGVEAKVKKYLGGDYSKLFDNTAFLKEPDIMFANLEGDVGTTGKDRQNLYSFQMDGATIPAMKDAGIDVVSFSNNHVLDFGRIAFKETLDRLHKAGIATCGAGLTKTEAEMPAILAKDGFNVGFLCFSDVGPYDGAATDTQSGILLTTDPAFDSIITNASKKVDALIVSFHWGVEYKTIHNARQEEIAKRAIDAGATMVEGEHPHVVEDISSYNGVPILYSLGNFIFDQAFSKETMQGAYITATLHGKTVSNVTPHTIVLDKNFVPSLQPTTK